MFSKILILLLLQILGSALPWSVDLASEEFLRGTQISLTGSSEDCVDVPNDFRPLSISTHGFCLRIFALKNCRGDTMAVFPASHNHQQLTKYSMDIKSLKSCNSAY